ncbi:hypothetical protein H0H87_008149 [Tephrocybe sp. NHM501043]|nr:hypothetical protein H0H87_008149 [Tephrocybe sp. NHM501043]
MGAKLDEILRPHLAELEFAYKVNPKQPRKIKPINILVITDGMPSDDPESPIVQAAMRLDAIAAPMDQVGIQFVQVGDDPEATAFLMELDDDLKTIYGNIRDIVDTTPAELTNGVINLDILMKILLGGINKREDRKSNNALGK